MNKRLFTRLETKEEQHGIIFLPHGEHPCGEHEEEGRDARLSRIDGRGDKPPEVELVPDERPGEGVLDGGEHAHEGAEQGSHHAHDQGPGDRRDAPEELLRAAPVAAPYEPDRHGCTTRTHRKQDKNEI